MAFVPLDRFLVRAPLLPGSPFGDVAARLRRDPLGARAIALASPSLAAHPTGERAARAVDRYARRAAFRATPAGLLAGVTVGALGPRTGGATGQPRPHLLPGWARVARLGRALLEDALVRRQVCLRHAPSLLRGADRVRWLALGAPDAEEREADLDARLARILDASRDWTPWQTLRAAAQDAGDDDDHDDGDSKGGGGDDDEAADELLLLLIDDGLLHHDLTPPLVGPPAAAWMAARLEVLQPRPAAAEILATARAALEAGDLAAGQAALRALPGAARASAAGERASDAGQAGVPDVVATLVHQPSQPVTLDRATVERAARLTPLLFRLQEALTPPAAERLLDRGAGDALATACELFGEGALDATAWQLGDYGVDPGADVDAGGASDGAGAETVGAASPPPALLRWLVDELVSASAARRMELVLDATALDRFLPALAPPATCELFLTPTTTRDGWLLGMHAPAGASWGRFAAALGPELGGAFAALDAAERAARPRQRRLDVAYAPSEALADLCAHPPVRERLLALSTWPARAAGDPTTVPGAVGAADLGLVVTPGLDTPALTDRVDGDDQRSDERRNPDDDGGEVIPSPLARVRSTTAPAGLFRLLAGFSLFRQHGPWALSLGALADLTCVPRVSIDGFVISPASWRVPPDLDARALRRWRRGEAGAPTPPRFVQVGAGDELLPVDLDAPQAWRDLAGQPRAWEIWPPLDETTTSGTGAGARKRGRASPRARTVDRDGRRIEAVVALVDVPNDLDARQNEARHQLIRSAGQVPPPRLTPPAPGWRTFSLYGVEQRQDDLLLDTIAPAVRQALDAGEIDRWFFVRYADARGQRPHLRVRVHAADRAHADAFAERLDLWLRGARAAGAVALVESGGYHPEVARFGGHDAMAAALRIFESDSDLACALLALERAPENPNDPNDPNDPDGPGDPDDGNDDLGAQPDRIDRLVAMFDSLTTGLGLSLPERHALARRRRHAEASAITVTTAAGAGERRAVDADFRARAAALRDALGLPIASDRIGERLAAHRAHVRAAVGALSDAERARLAPPLLHLGAVRLLGADRDAEARAYLFWERTLEGLLRSPPRDHPTASGKPRRRPAPAG